MTTSVKSLLFVAAWKKYLPFIRLLMKKSITGEQTLSTNRIDFERGGMPKRPGHAFMVSFISRRPGNIAANDEFTRAFIAAVQDDAVIGGYVEAGNYCFVFNNKYELVIKNITAAGASKIPVPGAASPP